MNNKKFQMVVTDDHGKNPERGFDCEKAVEEFIENGGYEPKLFFFDYPSPQYIERKTYTEDDKEIFLSKFKSFKKEK